MNSFWLTLLPYAALIVPLGVLARWSRIYPRLPLVLLSAVPALFSVLLIFMPGLLEPILYVDAVLIGIAFADLLTLPGRRGFAAEREMGHIASLQKQHPVALLLTNRAQRGQQITVRDDLPGEFTADPGEFELYLAAQSRVRLRYLVRSNRRGAFHLEKIYVRVRSRLRLWQRHLAFDAPATLNVYPDMKQLGEYAMLARTNRLSLLGVRRTRRIGQDNEFERLRDYTIDDNFKHIDWRSTARRGKLTVKDFQANQSQRIVFLLDCGRMMTNQAAGLSLLDHSLNAMLMLSYVALAHGDSVGLLCFSDEIHTYVPPRSGRGQMNRLLHATFDRFPQLVESRYDQAFLYLGSHCRRRSLVVLVTNVIDEVNSNRIEEYLANIAGKHLPLGVLLRDHRLFDAVDVDEPQGDALYRAAAAADILTWRHQVLADLQSKGVLSLDVLPEQMTAPLVNRYLDIKARHLL